MIVRTQSVQSGLSAVVMAVICKRVWLSDGGELGTASA